MSSKQCMIFENYCSQDTTEAILAIMLFDGRHFVIDTKRDQTEMDPPARNCEVLDKEGSFLQQP